ncbi:MAG: cyclic nucleotide-binding domain-containing protein [Candidatus Omnitrophica bacterium]|nr:cyclic nucleotide-binding domain-containing protein [Candidatus Omnitrophota bacterium]
MRLVEYKKDEVVYREGAEGGNFYIIVSGRFEAFSSSAGRQKTLAYLRRGDYFGEMSLLSSEPHSATLRALSDSILLELKKEDFKKTIEHNATVALELGRRLSSRLRGGGSRTLFKNDVIGVLDRPQWAGAEAFSFRLAADLFRETHQKTILLDLRLDAASPADPSLKAVSFRNLQNIENAPPELLSPNLVAHPAGFQVLTILRDGKDSFREEGIPLIFNHLAMEHRFIVVCLPRVLDETAMKVFTQSDSIYVVTDSDLSNINETKEMLADIEKASSLSADKISVVIHEVLLGMRTTRSVRKELFGDKPCFSLPPVQDEEHARVVRYIARKVSNSLVGLALGSGAALGLAHIGVLKALEREKIQVDMIAGSSIGALIGALYAVGLSAGQVEQAALEINSPFRIMRLMDPSLWPFHGLIRGRKVIRHFRSHLGNKTFEECRIPLRIVGANLSRRCAQVFESGLIADAVRTSIAIPAIFTPVFMNKEVIVDGGILSPLPVRVLHEAGAHKVIAVNVFPTAKDALERRLFLGEVEEKETLAARRKNWFGRNWFFVKKFFARKFSANIFDVLMNTIQTMESEIAEVESESADLVLRPVLANANWVEFFRPSIFIKKGEEETMKMLPKIKALVSQQNV